MTSEVIAALLALLGVVTGLLVNSALNRRNANEARKQPFLQRQLEYCFEVSQTVALLATTSDPAEWRDARHRFWQLYYGVLSIVQDREVEACMVACGKLIPITGEPTAAHLPSAELWAQSLKLGRSIRKLLFNAWRVQSLDSVLEGSLGAVPGFRQIYREEYDKQMKRWSGASEASERDRKD